MIRRVKPAVLGAFLTLFGVAATADRADAQVYYSYYPGTANYSDTTTAGSFWVPYTPAGYSSYYTPAGDPTSAYTPVRAWDGGWTISGYTSPAMQYYNSYRATPLGPRR